VSFVHSSKSETLKPLSLYSLVKNILNSSLQPLCSLKDEIPNANSCESEHLAWCLEHAFHVRFPSLSALILKGRMISVKDILEI